MHSLDSHNSSSLGSHNSSSLGSYPSKHSLCRCLNRLSGRLHRLNTLWLEHKQASHFSKQGNLFSKQASHSSRPVSLCSKQDSHSSRPASLCSDQASLFHKEDNSIILLVELSNLQPRIPECRIEGTESSRITSPDIVVYK